MLAGGESKRYGSPKAFANRNGQFFYEASFEALSSICEQVLIVTREELQSKFPSEYKTIVDCKSYRGQGPLAGIYTAMLQVKDEERFFVLPCDMPNIQGDILKNLQQFSQNSLVTAVKHRDDYLPLVSIWSKAMKPAIEERLKNNERSVLKLLFSVETNWVDGEQLSRYPDVHFQNVNKPT